MSGSPNVCPSSSTPYSVPVYNSNVSFNWTTSSNLQVVSGQGTNTANIQGTGSNGSGTITLTISNSQCGSYVINKPVTVGAAPTVTSITATMSGSCRAGGYQDWYIQANPSNPNATNWQWTVSNLSGSSTITFQNANSQSTYATVHGGGGVNVTYTDPCGNTSAPNGVTIYCPCGSGGSRVSSYPNPADKEMTVDYQTVESTDQATTSDAATQSKTTNSFSVELYNDKGKVLKSGKSANGKGVVLNKADIQNGNYFLHVKDGKEVTKKQVIIQH